MLPGIGFQEIIIIAIVAIVLFGKKLPDVAKSVGKSYHDFRKGLSDIQRNFDTSHIYSDSSSSSSSKPKPAPRRDRDDYEEATAPKFEPPVPDDNG
jgi:sec-independent protein translocase protein TatA